MVQLKFIQNYWKTQSFDCFNSCMVQLKYVLQLHTDDIFNEF